MLICPRCESENPNTNKFCQNCGAFLADKIDRNSDADTRQEANGCTSSGDPNTNVLWAIIDPSKKIQSSFTEAKTGNIDRTEIKNLADFFDLARNESINLKRYAFASQSEIFAAIASENSEDTYIRGKIIDRQPLQPTHLATLLTQHQERVDNLQGLDDSDDSYLFLAQFWNSVGVPICALPYLLLEEYTPVVPPVHEVWQQANGGLILLEDRSECQPLAELWSSEELPLAQVLWFLDEMAKLWIPLDKIGCSRSLLVESNIRVDEDRTLCLQQLFMNEPHNLPNLRSLARVWQSWSNKLQGDYRQNLNQILDRVISGEIRNVEQLRLQLQNLDSELDADERYITELAENNFFDYEMDEDSDLETLSTVNYSMQLDSIVDAGCTNVGSQRSCNEDCFAIETSVVKREKNTDKNLNIRGMYFVCDGMGGHEAGEVASAMAVETLLEYFHTHWQNELPDKTTIEEGILLANDTIYQTNLKNSRFGSGRMGTTLVMALVHNCQLAIAHVGDSRVYSVSRTHGLKRLTIDHEVGQREIERGVEPDIAYGRPDAYQLTQALGPRSNNYIRPEVKFLEITEDCLLLLCSDGLCDRNLIENHWQEYLEPLISSSTNLEDGLFKLIDFADRHNGHDNLTGISIRIKLKPEF